MDQEGKNARIQQVKSMLNSKFSVLKHKQEALSYMAFKKMPENVVLRYYDLEKPVNSAFFSAVVFSIPDNFKNFNHV